MCSKHVQFLDKMGELVKSPLSVPVTVTRFGSQVQLAIKDLDLTEVLTELKNMGIPAQMIEISPELKTEKIKEAELKGIQLQLGMAFLVKASYKKFALDKLSKMASEHRVGTLEKELAQSKADLTKSKADLTKSNADHAVTKAELSASQKIVCDMETAEKLKKKKKVADLLEFLNEPINPGVNVVAGQPNIPGQGGIMGALDEADFKDVEDMIADDN